MRVYDHAHSLKKRLGGGLISWDKISEDEIILLCYYFRLWCLQANVHEVYIINAMRIYIPKNSKWKGRIEEKWMKKKLIKK
jgi:hypothetical protein